MRAVFYSNYPARALVVRHAVLYLCSVSLLSALPVASASDSSGFIYSHEIGAQMSCGDYVQARDKGRRSDFRRANTYQAWLSGYLTAYNHVTPNTYDIAGGADMESMLLWIENYCRKNPLEQFAMAAYQLLGTLYPNRKVEGPPQKQASP